MQPPPRKVGKQTNPATKINFKIPGKLRQISEKPPRGTDQQTRAEEPARVRTAGGH
jgi:hypothetical protein